MADEKTEQTQDQEQEQAQTEEPKGEPQAVDWESKYREAIRHSREWEERAKRDKDAAQAWRDQQEAGKSEVEKLAEQVASLTQERDQLLKAEQQRKWAAEVAAEKGVPVSVLRGGTREEMESHADAILSSGLSMHSGVTDKGEVSAPSITAEQIKAIKNPEERVRAMAKHADKFNVRR